MKLFKLWAPAVIWASIIFYFSGIPDLKTGFEYDFFLRKAAHVTEYLILTFLLYRAFRGSFNMHTFGLFIYPAVFSFVYAVSDEIHQYFVLGRSCSAQDVLIDSIGIASFCIFIKIKKGYLCLTR